MLLNFDDVSAGLSESEFRFRLIGLELLMIDEQHVCSRMVFLCNSFLTTTVRVMATWVLTMRCQLHNSRSSTPGAVNVCNTAIGGTCSTWSLAEPSASSKESVVQEKSKYKTSLNQPQSRNPNHGCLIESLSISKLLPSLSFFSYLPPFVRL
ncbi:BnaAnng32810D [Brassica napus]|uniref:BnaAnng32810D protein n=1 Tax=Brassica napus TaxID=3708 RepID=A0A078JX25_BRANA|nr:BnaAnng32810D [Brassica napus]